MFLEFLLNLKRGCPGLLTKFVLSTLLFSFVFQGTLSRLILSPDWQQPELSISDRFLSGNLLKTFNTLTGWWRFIYFTSFKYWSFDNSSRETKIKKYISILLKWFYFLVAFPYMYMYYIINVSRRGAKWMCCSYLDETNNAAVASMFQTTYTKLDGWRHIEAVRQLPLKRLMSSRDDW